MTTLLSTDRNCKHLFDLAIEQMFYIMTNMRSIHSDSRRGLRALLLGFLLVLVVGAVLLLFQEEAASAPGRRDIQSVVVQPGETLWEIADRFAPESADLRVVVREFVKLNGLQSKVLKPGQVLHIPVIRF